MILFRTDGNPWIGTGHVMRCLSLADALRECNRDAVFVIAEPYLQQLIQSRGYICTVLGTAYDHMEEEIPSFLPLLERERPELVILDSYFVSPKYMETIKSVSRLLYIDDLNTFDYPSDAVVNYNIYGPELSYPQNKKYFLGPQYAPLRKEFQGLKQRVVKKQVENVLISTGGADPYHVALQCVKHLQEHPLDKKVIFHLVVGAMNQDVEELHEIASELPFIKLHCQVKDMCSLMLQCDVAVSASGSTLYELCACGIPTVTYILADNQILGAQAFQKAGLMPCVGDIRINLSFVTQIFSKLQSFINDWQTRQEISNKMIRLVDGNGAKRLKSVVQGIKK